jgi:hypothetical protein
MVSLNVTVSETYDLSTKIGKMALLGIHTPRQDIITRTWPGLLMQFKYVRPVSCDVRMACASMLPADPLQVGTETGQIAPTDMFNPILYTAVSNDSMSTLEGRLHYLERQTLNNLKGPSVISDNDDVTKADNERVYYTLLSDKHGWRHAMPQQGLEMTNLRPLVYSVLAVNGQPRTLASMEHQADYADYPTGGVNSDNQSDSLATGLVGRFRGAPQPMPRIPTTNFSTHRLAAGFDGAVSTQTSTGLADIDPIYVAMIVMPPAKLTTMYYRLVVDWNLEFSGLRSQNEINGFAGLEDAADTYYHSDYNTQSKSMTVKAGLADTKDADLNLVMQGQ